LTKILINEKKKCKRLQTCKLDYEKGYHIEDFQALYSYPECILIFVIY